MATSSLSSISSLCSCSARLLPTSFLASFSSFPPPASAMLFSRWMTGRKGGHCIRAMAPDLLGDLGARDPFPEELESNFGEKVLGNVNTEHRILIPNLAVLSLAERSCQPIPSSQPPLPKEEVEKLLKKIVGWRLVESNEGLKIQCTWRVRDYGCAVKLISRIYGAIATSGHYPDLHLEQTNQITAELWTSSVGGLSLNDFIVAAKIDRIETSDLAPKRRIWA